jgi:hypothetical protein
MGKSRFWFLLGVFWVGLFYGPSIVADSIQNGDLNIIRLQQRFRNAKPIDRFDTLRPFQEVWLYCHAYNASSIRYGADVNTEGWVYWFAPANGWIWQVDREIRGRWNPQVPFRILSPWGLSTSYRDVLGMNDFSSYRIEANKFLLSEGITLNPERVPDDLHSPSVATGRNDAFVYAECSIPASDK